MKIKSIMYWIKSNKIIHTINSSILYFISTSLLISLVASIMFKLFEKDNFDSFIYPLFYLFFYFSPVLFGYILANSVRLIENDIEALTSYDKSVYGQTINLSALRKMRKKKGDNILENNEYKYLGLKIIGYLLYVLYVLGFTLFIIFNGYINL